MEVTERFTGAVMKEDRTIFPRFSPTSYRKIANFSRYVYVSPFETTEMWHT